MSFVVPILVCLSVCLALRYFRSSNSYPLPPGPRRLPFIGSLFSLPTREQFKTYHEWSKFYNSDLLYFSVFGSSVVVVNSYEIAKDLLDRRSREYSQRPPYILLNKLMGADWDMGFIPYGKKLRAARRLCHRELRASAAHRFYPIQTKYCRELLQQLMDCPSPDNVMKHLRSMTGRSVLALTYGLEAAWNDPVMEIAEAFAEAIFEAATLPIGQLIDAIPLLQYIPSWAPGGGFQRKLPRWKKITSDACEVPFATAKAAIEAKTALPESLVSYSLNRQDYNTDMEEIVKSAAATMYVAAADTTVSTLGTFVLCMLAHPDIQKRAYEELNAKLKLQTPERRLPTMDDQASLPYVTSILKECMRWMVVGPFAIPHYTEVDDIYAGYHIPAKTTVIPNVWAMVHDENTYPDSFVFNPDRFMKDGQLNPDVMDPENMVFGFGRRVCQGKWVAWSSMWLTIASLLTVFEIRKAVDKEGNVIEPSYSYRSTLVLVPEAFTCQFVPRCNDLKEFLVQETAKK